MPPIPRDPSPDSTLTLLSEGYGFIANRCRRFGTDLFEARLMLRRAVCISGEEAARLFYEPGRFTRRGAMPRPTLALLQHKGSVQTKDGEAHRNRKRLFLSLMTPEARRRLCDLFEEEWRARIPAWMGMESVVLKPEAQTILCRAVCRWAGVPLAPEEAEPRAAEFAAMIEGAGSVGPAALRGLLLRRRTQAWARGLVERARQGTIVAEEGGALHAVAWHREPDGRLMDAGTAAIELINVLRPTVAVFLYILFVAMALHEHPEVRRSLRGGSERDREDFVQEVRRFYPFFPFIGGRVVQPFDWRGHRFAAGDWVLLDLYGTNHDPRTWGDPEVFRPARFRERETATADLVAQGAGDHRFDHRCPGEWITIDLMARATRLLADTMDYDVPPQDLMLDFSSMPALPPSGVVLSNVRMAQETPRLRRGAGA